MRKYKCTNCGYVYDPKENDSIPFETLPEDWICPDCGSPKSLFIPA